MKMWSGIAPSLALSAALLLSVTGVSAAPDQAKIDTIKAALAERLPDVNITTIGDSPIPGIYELISDGQIYYVSEGGDYIFDGDLIDMKNRTNLTEARKGSLHLALINAVDEKDMLIYEPEKKSERSITVFTDISCGYCRKLHAEMDELLEGGVRVRYLMFPRAGLNTQAHADLESVWCAADPLEAMTVAKSGGPIAPKNCETPIESHVTLAQQVGLRGTPLIYLDTGEMVPGYRSAAQLVQMIGAGVPMNTN